MKILREIMPNGMPFLVQVEVDYLEQNHWAVDPKKIKVYPIMFLDDNQREGKILEELPFANVKQRAKLAERLVKIVSKK